MLPRERIENALLGKATDKVAVTLYGSFIPLFKDIDSLLKRGLGIVHRESTAKKIYNGVDVKEEHYTDKGQAMIRTSYQTPVGDLSTLKSITPSTVWVKEYMFKSEEDYKALHYLFDNQAFVADYKSVIAAKNKLEDNYILRDQLPLEPLQEFISGDIMDAVTFSYQWLDNQDQILSLMEKNALSHQRAYEIVANGPALIANYGGNVIPQIIGPKVFEEHYLPYYQMAGKLMHANNKLLGTHLDGDNSLIMDQLAQTGLDYIEAYDPSMSPGLKEAQQYMKDQAIWINWPSGEHFRSKEEAAEITRDMIKEMSNNKKFIIGVTEDMPEGKWDELLHGIMDGAGYPR